jgi:predicted RNase H-like nuclease
MIYFVGLDLAWSPKNNSAISIAKLKSKSVAELVFWKDKISNDEEIISFINNFIRKESCLIAIDAPLLVPNKTGRRIAEDILQKLFMKYDASAYPANRKRLGTYGGLRGEKIVSKLEKIGIKHNPYIKPRRKCRNVIEVFPHPAIVSIFNLEKILKYKRGDLSKRLIEYKRYQKLLMSLDNLIPKLKINKELLNLDITKLRGNKLKQYEDLLDSIMCTYIAFYYWYWGEKKCAVLGDMKHGYIVTPIKEDMKKLLKINNSLIIHEKKKVRFNRIL